VPRAFIVRAPGSNATGQEIADFLAKKVIRYKQLKGGVQFVDAIPKNPSGKILRRQLREQDQKQLSQQSKL
jgi:4-coumarate--CoA ligase